MSVAAGVDSTPAGWRVVFACFVSAVFAWGFGFYAHGIYLVELQKAHGWSTGLISSVITGHYVLGALLLPRIAEAIGRFGPRTVFLCGLAVTGGSLLLLPSVTAPWCWYSRCSCVGSCLPSRWGPGCPAGRWTPGTGAEPCSWSLA